MAQIRLHKAQEYHYAQSRHAEAPQLPARALIVAPSGSGKTVVLVSLICDILRQSDGSSCFARVYIISPTVHLDPQWAAVKNFQRRVMRVSEEEESELYMDKYSEAALAKIVKRQQAVVALARQKELRIIPQICLYLDDVADNEALCRRSHLLQSLFLRGRHQAMSTWLSTQVYRSISPSIRKNLTVMLCFELRSIAERDAVVEENSGMAGSKKVMLQLYEEATREPHSFLTIQYTAPRRERFWERFEHRLIPSCWSDSESEGRSSGSDAAGARRSGAGRTARPRTGRAPRHSAAASRSGPRAG